MHIDDIYEEYPDKWVLVRVTKEDEIGEVVEGEVLFVSDDRDEMYKAIANVEGGSTVATLYTGEILSEGQSFAFKS
ncbi:hypothetical protein KC614_00600 [candidate division WWE3 bacterium]|uniref:Uncharacterized protein n=1 Tax=candidate division WWE3 bacterium TaxID=2053526 RepID=A0A955LJM9_UNCKA|nr:hypothetical protein [candidate division WWE3 bacterium]